MNVYRLVYSVSIFCVATVSFARTWDGMVLRCSSVFCFKICYYCSFLSLPSSVLCRAYNSSIADLAECVCMF